MYIDLIAGARPNFMKIAPIIRAIEAAQQAGHDIAFRLVHTGQHYDKNMSGSFFEQLNIPAPDVNLEAGSGTQAEQTAKIMTRYEALLLDKPTDLCLVVGDVTSTMACAIAAKKLHIPVVHVEAGIRSGDQTMPEEINRMVTDSITDFFFTTTPEAGENLQRSGIDADRIFFVGNTMIDTLLEHRHRFMPPPCWQTLHLQPKGYMVLTLHRPSNVDEEQHIKHLIETILAVANPYPVVFPVHPRTAKQLQAVGLTHERLHVVEPLSYLEFNYLVEHAKGVITDSGGITEETTVMGVPCITLRTTTERPETVTLGTNELVGIAIPDIQKAVFRLANEPWKKGSIPEKWDGQAAERIIAHLLNIQQQGKMVITNSLR